MFGIYRRAEKNRSLTTEENTSSIFCNIDKQDSYSDDDHFQLVEFVWNIQDRKIYIYMSEILIRLIIIQMMVDL